MQISLPFTSAASFSSSIKSSHVIFFSSVKFLIMLVAKFVHFCSLPVVVLVVVVVVVVVIVVGWLVGWLVGICLSTFRDSQKGTARHMKNGTDGLFHNSVTNYQSSSRSVPEDGRLISHVCYEVHGSQSFLTTYLLFR